MEKTVSKKLVPTLACLNSSKACLSAFWSSVAGHSSAEEVDFIRFLDHDLNLAGVRRRYELPVGSIPCSVHCFIRPESRSFRAKRMPLARGPNVPAPDSRRIPRGGPSKPGGASSINNRGDVVGVAISPKDGTIHAFLWTRETGLQDFGAFPGAIATVVPCCRTINDWGEMVGFSIDGTTFNPRALIWQGKVPVDLNTLIPNNSPWYLLGAASVNNAGEIVGFGLINGNVHAFLATPTTSEDDSESSAPSQQAGSSEGGKVVLTEDARKQIQKLLRFRLPVAQLTEPR